MMLRFLILCICIEACSSSCNDLIVQSMKSKKESSSDEDVESLDVQQRLRSTSSSISSGGPVPVLSYSRPLGGSLLRTGDASSKAFADKRAASEKKEGSEAFGDFDELLVSGKEKNQKRGGD